VNARVFRNEVRRKLYGLIEGTSGAIITELSREVGLSHSTVSYHLKILEESGAVLAKRDGRVVRYYTASQFQDVNRRLEPLVKRARVVAILKLIDAEPNLVPFNIAKRLEVSVPTIMWHLQKLQAYGAITMEKRNGHYDITLRPEVRASLARQNGHPPEPPAPSAGDHAAEPAEIVAERS